MKHIEGLAAFFGVPVNYFFNDDVANRVDTELDMIVALRETPIRHRASRERLSPESLSAIAEMIEHVRSLEGLPERSDTLNESDTGVTNQNRQALANQVSQRRPWHTCT